MDKRNFKNEFEDIAQTIYYDVDDNLREKTKDPEAVLNFLNQVEELLVNNGKNSYQLCGILGNLYRILEKPTRAINYLERALSIANEERDCAKIAVTLIRLGEALKYNEKHQQAMECFDQALTLIHTHKLDNYLDFALQHKGKCLLELKRYEEAEQYLRKALKLRKQKKDTVLIDSTEQVLKYMEEIDY